jgi:hypothetical protein
MPTFAKIDLDLLTQLPAEVIPFVKAGDYQIVKVTLAEGKTAVVLAIHGVDFVEIDQSGAPVRKLNQSQIVSFDTLFQPEDSTSRAFFKRLASG